MKNNYLKLILTILGEILVAGGFTIFFLSATDLTFKFIGGGLLLLLLTFLWFSKNKTAQFITEVFNVFIWTIIFSGDLIIDLLYSNLINIKAMNIKLDIILILGTLPISLYLFMKSDNNILNEIKGRETK